MNNLSIFKQFSEYPGLRHCDISDNSGEEFYHKILNSEFYNSYISKSTLTIDLDYVDGYAPSFLDEAFGNLVYDFTLANVKKYIIIVSNQEPHWKDMIEDKTYIQWEQRRIQNEKPKVTKKHAPWYRLVNNQIQSEVWEVPT